MDGGEEIHAGCDRGKADDKDADRSGYDVGVRIIGREWRVEGPAGVDAASDEHIDRERCADDIKVPRYQIEARERHVRRADHHRQNEIAHGRRDRGHKEEPDHDDAVDREQPVVFVRGQEQAGRADELEPHHRDGDAADEEKHRDRQRIENGDALVIGGGEPRHDGVAIVEIALAAAFQRWHEWQCGVRHRDAPCDPSFTSVVKDFKYATSSTT